MARKHAPQKYYFHFSATRAAEKYFALKEAPRKRRADVAQGMQIKQGLKKHTHPQRESWEEQRRRASVLSRGTKAKAQDARSLPVEATGKRLRGGGKEARGRKLRLSKFSKHFARRCAFVALAYVITSWNNGPNNGGGEKHSGSSSS